MSNTSTKAKPTYEGTIQELFINAVSTPFNDGLEAETEHTVAAKVEGQHAELLSLVPQDKRLDAEDLIDGITYEYETSFYVAGFRQGAKLMLDCLVGGGSGE